MARGTSIVHKKHWIGANRTPSYQEKREQKFVHGLVGSPHTYTSRAKIISEMSKFLTDNDPSEIIIAKVECRKFIPKFKERIIQIRLRKWRHRPAHYSFHAAYQAKIRIIGRELRTPPKTHTHEQYREPEETPITLGEWTKLAYGYQCALYGAFELMHYYLAPPESEFLTVNPLDFLDL